MSRKIKFRAWLIGSERMLQNVGFDNTSEADAVVEYMQYTGLKLNGVDIYDKDIIRFTSPRDKGTKRGHKPYNDMIVVWGSDKHSGIKNGWHVVWRSIDGTRNLYQRLENILDEHHQVIGNIYENPELLAGKAGDD